MHIGTRPSFSYRTLFTPMILCATLLYTGCDNTNVLKEVNSAPILSIITPLDGAEVQEYAMVEFTGKVTDSQESSENLSILWNSSLDGLLNDLPSDASGNLYFATNSLTPGVHSITLTATDSTGLSKNSSITLSVIDQEDDPTIELRSPTDTMGEEGVSYLFEVLVNDVQDAPEDLLVSFQSNIDGEFCTPTADELGIAGCSSALSVGQHQITMTVEDSHANTNEVHTSWLVLSSTQVDNDGDGYTEEEGDCNDAEDTIAPDVVESYNDIDDNCNGIIDENTVASDDDGDGYSELDGDCNDANVGVHPDAIEVCNMTDDDCNGEIDDGTSCYDDDGDGYSELDGDCDDDQIASFPNNPEVPDGIDNNCDGDIDEGSEFFDDDGDCFCESSPCYGGYFPCATFSDGDCDDNNNLISPAEDEVCDGGIDNDCSGAAEDNAIDALIWYQDSDNDGYGNAASFGYACTQPAGFVSNTGDCNDNQSQAWTNNPEVCDGIDNDCNNQIDEGVGTTYYADGDQDGYGNANQTVYACSLPPGYTRTAGDCNDTLASVAPNLTEVCGDGVDNNCNGTQNEQNATSCTTYYVDADNDGYGVGAGQCWCQATNGYNVTNASDCYDGNAQAQPGQTGYFTVHRGDGSFDYNCNQNTEKEFTIGGSCNGWGSSIGDCTMNTAGWDGATPACGGNGNYIVDNDSCSAGCYVWGVPTCCTNSGPSYTSRTQRCR